MIKYFFKKSVNSVVCKNLFDWKNQYEAEDSEKKNFQFLKQYLTLNKAELFFAEKIVFIEGDTEQINPFSSLTQIESFIESFFNNILDS
jgi:hypothetical protein